VIDAAYDTQDDPEVDLAPLLQSEDALAFEVLGGAGAGIENPSRMIIMSNPDRGVSVGLSGARNGPSQHSHSNSLSRHGNIGSELSHSLQALTTASVGTSNMSYRSRGDWSRNTLQSSHDANGNNTMTNRNLANFVANSHSASSSNDISGSIGRSLWRRSNDTNSNRETPNHFRNDGSRDLPNNR